MQINLGSIAGNIASGLTVPLIVAIIKLWERVRVLEVTVQNSKDVEVQDRERREQDEGRREDDAKTLATTLNHVTVLLGKVETLLETGLKRLDLVEKKVFNV